MATLGKQIADFFSPGTSSDNDEGLRGLFINELKGIYYAEKALVDNMPNMAEAATTDQVRNAFETHLAETRNQVTRLEQVFQSIGVEPDTMTCNAVDGLADDANVVIDTTEAGSLTRDAGLIIAGQKVEHHEIATYGSLHSLATLLGYTEAAQLIEQSLNEEKNTDKKLTQIAESFINERAKSEGNNDSNYSHPNRATYASDRGDNYSTGSQSQNSGGTYQSGESYSGSMTENTGSGYGRSNDATLGGTLGV